MDRRKLNETVLSRRLAAIDESAPTFVVVKSRAAMGKAIAEGFRLMGRTKDRGYVLEKGRVDFAAAIPKKVPCMPKTAGLIADARRLVATSPHFSFLSEPMVGRLKDIGVHTVSELAAQDESTLLRLPGMGMVKVAAISEAIDKHYLTNAAS